MKTIIPEEWQEGRTRKTKYQATFKKFAHASHCWNVGDDRAFLSYVIWSAVGFKSVLLYDPLTDATEPSNINFALDIIPDELQEVSLPKFSHIEDVKNHVATEIAENRFLDDIEVQRRGRSKTTIPLNQTTYPQPRRRTFSVIGDVVSESKPKLYTLQIRQIQTPYCSPMPMALFELGKKLWRAASPHLTALSQACPPNHCQILFYHALFGGEMGLHRDYQPTRGKGVGDHKKIRGTNVLLYTIGAPMIFRYVQCVQEDYMFSPKRDFKGREVGCPLYDGTLFVQHPWDDERFMHDVTFSPYMKKQKKEVSIRLCFRWLQKPDAYYCNKMSNNRQLVYYN